MLAPDTLLQHRYRIVRQIGKGGMGAVYEAIDQRLGNRVALKQTLTTSDQMARSLEREARLLAALRHASLPKVTDHFVDGSGQYLVMEFIAGEDLDTLLTRRKRAFEVENVLAWADQLLRVLEYLHRQHPPVLHRDIKPQNLKLTADGEVVLLDFGLAKGIATSHTHANESIFGYTPHYAPLEQIDNSGTEPRSDLYSLAATLYHLVTGVQPPDALTRATAILRQLPDPLIPPAALNPVVPPAVDRLVMQAMALNIDERPSSAASMRADLEQAGQSAMPANREESLQRQRLHEAETIAADGAAPCAVWRDHGNEHRQSNGTPAPSAHTAPYNESSATQCAGEDVARTALAKVREVMLQIVTAVTAAVPSPWRRYAIPAALIAPVVVIALGVALAGRTPARPETALSAVTAGHAVTPVTQAAPTITVRAMPSPRPPIATQITASTPVATTLSPTEVYTATLPIALTVQGTDLDRGRTFALVADDHTIALQRESATGNRATLRLARITFPIQGELTLTLAIDGVPQPEIRVTLRDFLAQKLVQGVRPEYVFTDRVGIDELGAYTSLRMLPDATSDRFAVLRNGDEVELLRVDTPEWYQVRIRRSVAAMHIGAIGWIERWLIDSEGAPSPPQPVFIGRLGATATDAAIRCGTEFRSSIYGSVEDKAGNGIAGATITVTSADGRNRFSTTTQRNGTYVIPGLGCTNWIVRLVAAPGIPEVQANTITVTNLNGGKYTAAEVRFRQAP
ncbi:MAG: protein kinase [Chloroflexi bacterium]|nr:protein kinase [Chloroflexota bacterium]